MLSLKLELGPRTDACHSLLVQHLHKQARKLEEEGGGKLLLPDEGGGGPAGGGGMLLADVAHGRIPCRRELRHMPTVRRMCLYEI